MTGLMIFIILDLTAGIEDEIFWAAYDLKDIQAGKALDPNGPSPPTRWCGINLQP